MLSYLFHFSDHLSQEIALVAIIKWRRWKHAACCCCCCFLQAIKKTEIKNGSSLSPNSRPPQKRNCSRLQKRPISWLFRIKTHDIFSRKHLDRFALGSSIKSIRNLYWMIVCIKIDAISLNGIHTQYQIYNIAVKWKFLDSLWPC